MTQNMEELRRKIQTATDLQGVVSTMKVLSSINIRQYQQAVQALDEYNETIQLGLRAVLKNRPHPMLTTSPDSNRLIAIVFGSDQGLVGLFNDRVVRYAVHQMADVEETLPENRRIIAVGLRLTPHLQDLDQPVHHTLNVPGSESGIVAVIMRILFQIDSLRQEKVINRMVLYFNRPMGSASYYPTRINLLPLQKPWLDSLTSEPWGARAFPMATMEWDRLFTVLIQQYFFVSLYRAMANSLASENASRLASMENAESNIDERLDTLNMIYKRVNQTMITEELFDVIAGFEALKQFS